jgi:archaellum component FlaC
MADDIKKLQSSIEDLQKEVRELREVVNMLIDIIVTMEGEDHSEAAPPFMEFDRGERDPRFSM